MPKQPLTIDFLYAAAFSMKGVVHLTAGEWRTPLCGVRDMDVAVKEHRTPLPSVNVYSWS